MPNIVPEKTGLEHDSTGGVNTKKVSLYGWDSASLTKKRIAIDPSGNTPVVLADTASLDSFGRQRISNPVSIFDAQLTYDLQPLVLEKITNGAGATVTHDTTNRCALMTFSSTPTGGTSASQASVKFKEIR